jgi:hypothetical protein
MTRLPAIALLLSITTGCAVAFRPGKPVEVRESVLGDTYWQEGEPIRQPSLLDGLEAVDASHQEARTARGWAIGSAATGSVGGLGIGVGIVHLADGKSDGWAWVAGGAAVTAVGVWLGSIAGDHTAAAVKAYNGQLPPQAPAPAPPKVSVAPYVAPVAPAAGHGQAGGIEGGLVMRF